MPRKLMIIAGIALLAISWFWILWRKPVDERPYVLPKEFKGKWVRVTDFSEPEASQIPKLLYSGYGFMFDGSVFMPFSPKRTGEHIRMDAWAPRPAEIGDQISLTTQGVDSSSTYLCKATWTGKDRFQLVCEDEWSQWTGKYFRLPERLIAMDE